MPRLDLSSPRWAIGCIVPADRDSSSRLVSTRCGDEVTELMIDFVYPAE